MKRISFFKLKSNKQSMNDVQTFEVKINQLLKQTFGL